jgi:hypothetical protein
VPAVQLNALPQQIEINLAISIGTKDELSRVAPGFPPKHVAPCGPLRKDGLKVVRAERLEIRTERNGDTAPYPVFRPYATQGPPILNTSIFTIFDGAWYR